MKTRNKSFMYRVENRPTMAQLRTIPALSVKQPWADWIVSGEKRIEYRKWRIRTPQPILIHATTLLPKSELVKLARYLGDEEYWLNEFLQLQTHAIIGKVTVTECVEDSGMFLWRLSDPVSYRWAYVCPGGLKLFKVKVC